MFQCLVQLQFVQSALFVLALCDVKSIVPGAPNGSPGNHREKKMLDAIGNTVSPGAPQNSLGVDRQIYDALKSGVEGPGCKIARRVGPSASHDLNERQIGLSEHTSFVFEVVRRPHAKYCHDPKNIASTTRRAC